MKNSPARNNALRLLIAGFLAACTALLVIAKSPGNMNRDTVLAELSFDLIRYSVISAFKDVPLFLLEWVRNNTVLILILFLGGFSIPFIMPGVTNGDSEGFGQTLPRERRSNHLLLGLFLLAGAYVLLWSGFIPQYAVMGIRPPDRAIFTPLFIFIWMFVLLGIFTGYFFNGLIKPSLNPYARMFAQISLIFLMIWMPFRSAFSFAKMAPSLSLYARLWDERDIYLRQQSFQGAKLVSVPSLRRNPALHDIQSSFWLEGDIQEAPDYWINQAAADYYRLMSITGKR